MCSELGEAGGQVSPLIPPLPASSAEIYDILSMTAPGETAPGPINVSSPLHPREDSMENP